MSQPYVLVVDSSPLTHERVEESLAGSGVGLRRAFDADGAMAFVADAPPALVLCGASLPRANGYDLCARLRGRLPDLPVLLMAGGFEVYDAGRAAAAGAAGFLQKPLTRARVRGEVSRFLGPLSDGPVGVIVPIAPPVAAPYSPPTSDERLATFLPRDYAEQPPVRVDPDVVGPALERAILEVLPEVVEVVLRRALQSSAAFRDLVEVAVDEAVRDRLPEIARRVVHERLAEIEARGADDPDAV